MAQSCQGRDKAPGSSREAYESDSQGDREGGSTDGLPFDRRRRGSRISSRRSDQGRPHGRVCERRQRDCENEQDHSDPQSGSAGRPMTFMTLAGLAVLKSTTEHIQLPQPRKDAQAESLLASILPMFDNPQGSAVVTPVTGDNVICSLDVADWELAKVLRVLSQQTKVNVITMSAPDKKLTIRLSDIKLADIVMTF